MIVIASLRRVNDDVNGHLVHLHQAADCKPSTEWEQLDSKRLH